MSAIPTTTAPGPDQARLREVMRRLAEVECTEAPILSAYLDVRPEAHGERPAERPQLIALRDELNTIERGFEPGSPQAPSFGADRQRLDELLETEDLDGIGGLAVFACSHVGLWEVVRTQAEFDPRVHVGPTAELFQLARLLDDSLSAIVAVLDTSTCRLFVTRRGGLFQREVLDEPSAEHKRHDQGGWSQARFQRHVDMQDKRFAKEAADAIEHLARVEHPQHIILAGDERVIPVLEGQMAEHLRGIVDHVARIDIHAPPDEVQHQIGPLLAALEASDDEDLADRAIGFMRAGGLGVAGIDDTMAALEAGQVDELVIDETVQIDEDLRTELIRQAALTDSRVTVIREHEALARYEGVAATLRFKI